jgi:hypothetical protein
MIGIHKTPNIQYLPSPRHWKEIEQTKRGKKWATKMKKALKQIRTETENDQEIVQMRCEPTRGTHALLRVITTGSLKEKIAQ